MIHEFPNPEGYQFKDAPMLVAMNHVLKSRHGMARGAYDESGMKPAGLSPKPMGPTKRDQSHTKNDYWNFAIGQWRQGAFLRKICKLRSIYMFYTNFNSRDKCPC